MTIDRVEARARVNASHEAVAQAQENRGLHGAGLGTNAQVLEAVTLQISAAGKRDNCVLDESLVLL